MKLKYEEINVEILIMSDSDIITASKGAFDGEDDELDW